MTSAFTYLGCIGAAAVLTAGQALACSINPISEDERLRQAYDQRMKSKPVVTRKDCSFVNGGVHDTFSGGPAIDLGSARFYQVLETVEGKVTSALVADCGTREVIRLNSAVIDNENRVEGPCGGEDGDRYTLVGAGGTLSLTEGKDVKALSNIAKGMSEVYVDEAVWPLRMADRDVPVLPKDRVDFLCGCRIFYPDSAGARK
ncbi:hypothetical protein ACN2XU_03860 [Primorskyibacter sp. 2E107]|uniref:hypothetical protein n=1 Tax=Primorskyibacter sp. 2E107 TaxID=3403458 RepID=UPI003AF48B78